ncbi:MAG: hypothetical protein AAF702_16020 [Chloroflexota bacterium]
MNQQRVPRQSYLPWIVFVGWFLLLGLLLVGVIASGELPVDYKAYQQAADAIAESVSPYSTPAESQVMWRTIHELAVLLETDQPIPADIDVQGGPYIYAPTLALLIHQARINAIIFLLLVIISVVGFGWLWLHAIQTETKRAEATRAETDPQAPQQWARPSAWWLLLIVGSWDVIASFGGLNVELILLFLALLAAWLLWQGRGLWAALPITFVVLVKPFYALLFATFGLIMMMLGRSWRSDLGTLTVAATSTFVLIGLEILRWPNWLRTEAIDYFQNAVAHQWLVMPIAEQTPMSVWNRTPLQVLVNYGVDVGSAQWMAIGLWALLLLVSLWWIRQRTSLFSFAFALAYVLFLWGRPVSWTLPNLEIILVLALWPLLTQRWQRIALLTGVVMLGLSHWVALVRSILGINANLFTLQSAAFPWETLLVLPLSWFIIVNSARFLGETER